MGQHIWFQTFFMGNFSAMIATLYFWFIVDPHPFAAEVLPHFFSHVGDPSQEGRELITC